MKNRSEKRYYFLLTDFYIDFKGFLSNLFKIAIAWPARKPEGAGVRGRGRWLSPSLFGFPVPGN